MKNLQLLDINKIHLAHYNKFVYFALLSLSGISNGHVVVLTPSLVGSISEDLCASEVQTNVGVRVQFV